MSRIFQRIKGMPIQKKLAVGFSAVIVAVTLFASAMYNAVQDLQKTSDWVVHTQSVISQGRHLVKLLVDMETGERGYLIVGKESFLEPFLQGQTDFDHELTELKKTVADNPDQVALLEEIDALSLQWRNQAANPSIAKRREIERGGKDLLYLQNLLTQGTGKGILDQLRQTLETLRQAVLTSKNLTDDARHKGEILSLSLAKDMVDQETGQRGFLITGQENFLEPFNAGRKAFTRHMEEVRRLEGLDDHLSGMITEVGLLAREWHERAADPEIEARREINLTKTTMKDISAFIETEVGKKVMDRLRVLLDQFVGSEQKLMAQRLVDAKETTAHATLLAMSGTILAVVIGLLVILVMNRAIAPLNELTAAMGEIAEGEEFTRRVHITGMAEVVRIADVFNRMAQNTENQYWLKTSATDFSKLLQETGDKADLTQQITSKLGDLLHCGFAAFYLHNEENSRFELTGSYRFKERKHSMTSYAPGEGLVGQCALEKRTMILTGVPEDYIQVHSGLGESPPDTVMAVPIVFQNSVLGVLELATFGSFTPVQEALIDEQIPNLALGLQSLLRSLRTQELLEQTQVQAEELQVREEELQDNNVLLERQAQELKASRTELEESNEQLQSQQEELRVANEELEEKAQDLKESRVQLEEKNHALEEIKIELERRADELAISSKYKSEFLANMSHELRTPLNSLLILSKMLADNKEGNLTDKQVEYARTVHDSGSDLLTLINDILDLSKIESGKMEVHVEPVHLDDFAAGIERKFGPLAAEKKIEFKIETDEAPGMWRSDGQKLGQVVKNLLSNAIKFTSEGRVTLGIGPVPGELRLYNQKLASESALAFTVADTGIGIPKEKLNTVFEAFQQADGSTSRKYGGTGLGLSISRELAKLLGGEIHIESEEGKGSRFTLVIPTELEIADPIPKPAPQPPEAAPQPQPPTPVAAEPKATPAPGGVPDDRNDLQPGDRSILIIEDDRRFAAIVADVARERGFGVLVAQDGETGLHFADYYQPSGIVLDIGLPGMDGWQVMERLKDNAKTRHIPVHFMSANDNSLDALRKGAIGFLTKPVSMGDMEQAFGRIEDMIDRPVKRLLLVEDDPAQLKSLRELIGNGDVETVTAQSGAEAKKLLAGDDFDCIVLDLGLPDMSGMELLEKLRSGDGRHRIPVVIYTGKELDPKERAALDHYAESIIIKDARSPERLLDDTALFLHRVESNLPEEQRRTIRMLHDTESLFDGRKILVVDDDMRNTFSLSAILQDKGMVVLTASNGKEALEQLEADPDVSIVLMDIMMPEMDGYEATRKIRIQKRFTDLPVIALTAKAMKGDRRLCIEAGASDYLAKPVDTEKLLSMMRVWLYR